MIFQFSEAEVIGERPVPCTPKVSDRLVSFTLIELINRGERGIYGQGHLWTVDFSTI